MNHSQINSFLLGSYCNLLSGCLSECFPSLQNSDDTSSMVEAEDIEVCFALRTHVQCVPAEPKSKQLVETYVATV